MYCMYCTCTVFRIIAFAYDAVHFVRCLRRLREEKATTDAAAFNSKNIYLHSTLDTT